MDTDRELRFANQERLRDLKRTHGGEVAVFCSHDARELSALQSGGLAGLRSLTRNLAADAAPAAAPA
ncbi:MAG: hypothetical protein ACEQR8_00960 [Cypionkella sp.]